MDKNEKNVDEIIVDIDTKEDEKEFKKIEIYNQEVFDHFTCKKMEVYKNDKDTATVRLIDTYLENIETQTILRPLADTHYIGVNGGFFDSNNYFKPPTSGSSICYTKGLDGKMVEYDGVKRVANFHENQYKDKPVSRKTMFIYKASGNRISVAYRYVTHVDELRREFDVLYAMGGTDYSKDSWGSDYTDKLNRTVVAWTKPVVGVQTRVYLIQVWFVSIPELKTVLYNLNLDPEYSVVFDGGGSSNIKYYENGKLVCKGLLNRYLYNIIRLIKS